jgi:hypothetical protein
MKRRNLLQALVVGDAARVKWKSVVAKIRNRVV